MKYSYKTKKQKKGMGIIPVIIIAILASVVSISLYDMYMRVDVNYQKQDMEATRMSTTGSNREENNSQNVEDIIESASKSIVGISKIKDNGNSIFLKDSAEQLGLRHRCSCFGKWIYNY